ncbi:MAG: potassium/proton antiporter [Alphaproteobacteria bacterium]|nr:potassium/proton antiporter [Alphaproteobacteria bacterium]
MDVINTLILTGAALLVASIFTSLISFRIGAPLLLVFLMVGLGAGEDGLGIEFDHAPTAFFVGSVALALILFDSGFHTPAASWRAAAGPAVMLATLGVVVTTAIVGVAAHLILGFSWPLSLLLAAIVSSTDAAAVFFLLRVGGIHLRDKIRSTLEIESGSNDPVAILLTLVLAEMAVGGIDAVEPAAMALTLVASLAGGLAAGAVGGFLIVGVVNRFRLDAGLVPVVVLALALLVFGATNVAGASGYLAVYVAGLIAGNSRLTGAESLRRFQAGLTWLAQIFMFVTLGLLATPSQFPKLALPALGLAAVLIFVARPLAVWMCLLPFRFSRFETAFAAWVGLRGAVSILLALVPMMAGLPEGRALFDMVFMIVIVSLVVQGWTIRPIARFLKLIVPPRAGPVERIELELPGPVDCEIVGYTVRDNSPVARGQRLPRWARPSLILRGREVLNVHTARHLKPGDHVYLFTSPGKVPLLDRLFAGAREIPADDVLLYGDFALSPDVTAGWVAEMYGQPLAVENAQTTLAELFRAEYRDDIEIGDRLAFGSLSLIVRDMQDGHIAQVGLALEPLPDARPRLPLFQTGGELRAALRGLWARIRS